MDKEVQLHYLRQKYIELSRQFLMLLQSGKAFSELQGLSEEISTVVAEIEMLEKS